MESEKSNKDIIILTEGEGRKYNMGSMQALFKADEGETDTQYSVSEWWLDPHSEGPGPQLHEENTELFSVLEGTCSFLVGNKWIDANKGTFLRIPANTIHDFANNTDYLTGVLNVFIPGGFERNMAEIMKWYEDQK